MNIINEKRIELTDEIVAVYLDTILEFYHEDTTSFNYRIPIVIDSLKPCKVFDYDLTEEDVAWLTETCDKIKMSIG